MIGKYLKITSGFAFKSSKFNDQGLGMPLIRIRDVGQRESSTFYDGEFDNTYLIKKGDFLVGMDGEFRLAEWNGPDSLLNQRVCKLEPDPEFINRRYFYHALPAELKTIEKATSFVTVKHLSVKKIKEIDIPLPPLATQQKIAAILDAADSHRQKTKQLFAKYDELAQNIFIEMFGSNHYKNREWELKEIKDIVSNEKGSLRTGPFGSDLLHSEFVDEGIPVLGIDNAVNNKFEWKQKRHITEQKYQMLKRYKVKPRDVIITIMGTVGRTAVVPNEIGLAINTKHLAALTLNQKLANPKFIAFSFHSDPFILNQIRKNGKGAIMNGLNLGIIKSTKIKLPPIALQNKFENILNAIETQRNQVETSLKTTENLFNSLLQKAFKGELVK